MEAIHLLPANCHTAMATSRNEISLMNDLRSLFEAIEHELKCSHVRVGADRRRPGAVHLYVARVRADGFD